MVLSQNIKIADKIIGPRQACFIIAEAGSNHNGDLDQAKELIKVAAIAGADAVKFQNFKASKLYTRKAGESDYLKQKRSIYKIIEEMEMPDIWIPQLAEFCEEQGIIFCSSPFDEESADLIDPYVHFFKIASYEMDHLPLIKHIAKKGKPTIISTGTADLDEVRRTVQTFFATGNQQLALMQCTAKYPAPIDALNIGAIRTMMAEFKIPVGLSDHSREPIIGPVTAIGAGAVIIEKHFTLSNDMDGPDHAFAVEPDELKQMVAAIRQAEAAMGTGEKILLEAEEELRDFARRSIFTIKPVSKGEPFSRGNVAVLRKGKMQPGLPPSSWDEVLRYKASKDIVADMPLTEGDLDR